MSSDDLALVMFGDDKLSVVEKPARDCKAVVEARKTMLGTVDLESLLNGLTTVGKFVRIAYNGVAGDTELQIMARQLGFEIAELCDESGLTITNFRMTADSIITDLTGAYQFFLDGLDEMAIIAVESVGDSAKKMADAADDLCKRFAEEKKKVLDVCTETAAKKGFRESEVERLKQKQVDMAAEADRVTKEKALAAESEKKLEQEIEKAIQEEMIVSENLAPTVGDVILGIFSGGAHTRARDRMNSETMRNIQSKINDLRRAKAEEVERQRNALKDMENCIKEMAKCSDQTISVEKQAITALHGAVGALSNLATIMQDVAVFWRSLQMTCDKESKDTLVKQLKAAQKYSPEQRLLVYTNKKVKQQAVEKYVTWVAMEVVCDEYIEKIKFSRQELHGYLRENPTIEEAHDRIPLLCREFSEQIIAANKKLDRDLKQIQAAPEAASSEEEETKPEE